MPAKHTEYDENNLKITVGKKYQGVPTNTRSTAAAANCDALSPLFTNGAPCQYKSLHSSCRPTIIIMSLILSPLLILIAFILLLLVTLSAPFIHPIYLFRLSVHASSSLFEAGINASAQFGVFGYCLSAIQVSYVPHSPFAPPAPYSHSIPA